MALSCTALPGARRLRPSLELTCAADFVQLIPERTVVPFERGEPLTLPFRRAARLNRVVSTSEILSMTLPQIWEVRSQNRRLSDSEPANRLAHIAVDLGWTWVAPLVLKPPDGLLVDSAWPRKEEFGHFVREAIRQALIQRSASGPAPRFELSELKGEIVDYRSSLTMCRSSGLSKTEKTVREEAVGGGAIVFDNYDVGVVLGVLSDGIRSGQRRFASGHSTSDQS